MKIIFTAIMIATLAGCSTGTSTYFAQKDIDSIKKGVTSERSVLSMFGTPTSQSVDSQGNKKYRWDYDYDSGAGDDQVEVKTVDVTINKHGLVDSYDSYLRQ
ncbi:outer membrane protein assembly factor BamE domain-containing protein [[Enterobacter] lignolyticus]|uniref:outer membrane protein assembly factor BamE domain-containing protein n=1 Tax=[Enterobacter] lignolyticus TaxID=1334193 RepID=UPI0008FFCE77|nr:outer membrane protein assembly factor BamE [[Enterobacter] lignolyticus]